MTKTELLKAIAEHLPKYVGATFTSSEVVKDFFKMRLALEEREHFEIALLTTQNELIEVVRLFSGTIDAASVYPREVVKIVLEKNAAAVIFAHNHPSGEPEPSNADIHITDRLCTALRAIDVRCLDHIIVGHLNTVAFSERGLI